jgi:DNA-binding response OmpR family regulator
MRLLVAEDHPSLARSLATGLRDQGHAVDLTFDGNEAMHLATVHKYDCILLDMMLPGMDGWAIIENLRKEQSKTPVICLTARDAMPDRVKGLDMGADDYIVKPFIWDELLARLRATIRRGHAIPSSNIVVGDLEIDTAGKVVRRGGAAIALSAKEFALLEYLALRQGQVVSRTDIWEHLYDQNDENVSNVVDVYIVYLRNKIDKTFPQKLIHTRRGLGYVLQADPVSE